MSRELLVWKLRLALLAAAAVLGGMEGRHEVAAHRRPAELEKTVARSVQPATAATATRKNLDLSASDKRAYAVADDRRGDELMR